MSTMHATKRGWSWGGGEGGVGKCYVELWFNIKYVVSDPTTSVSGIVYFLGSMPRYLCYICHTSTLLLHNVCGESSLGLNVLFLVED